jgi:molybdate transport system permease protein
MPLSPFVLSLEVAVVATLLAAVVGLPVARLLARRAFFGREALDALFSLPLVMPPTVLGYFLLVLLGRRGTVGRVYQSITGDTLVFTKKGAMIAAAVSALPLVVKFGRAAFAAVDPELVLAARTLGATPSRAFFAIELPLALRGLAAALGLAFARALGDFGATLMVAGDTPGVTQTASMAIYDAAIAGRASEANVLVVLLSAISFVALYATNRFVEGRTRGR